MRLTHRMAFFIMAALLLAGGPMPGAFASILAGPIPNPANGHSYYLLSQNKWTLAEAEAVTMGAHLVTVNDAAEQTWVYSTFSQYGGTIRALWTGLNDAAVEGTFVWASGEPFSYSNWDTFEPNNTNTENWVYMIGPTAGFNWGKWNDLADFPTANSGPLHGVVEVVPEPGMAWIAALVLPALVARRRSRQR